MVIGYTTGVYDLFHIGHLNLLKNAKAMCDKLVVGVTVDDLVTYKGKRAMIPFEDRIEIVRSCKYVDVAVPQYDMDKLKACKQLGATLLFVGNDWYETEKWKKFEKEFAKENVKIVYFPYTKGVSSTIITEALYKMRGWTSKQALESCQNNLQNIKEKDDERMVDKKFCMSSYLALRYVEREGVDFCEKLKYKTPKKQEICDTIYVRSSGDINEALEKQFESLRMRGGKLGLLLSGGMDSGILASYMPGCDAYTFRFIGGKYQEEELKRAEQFAAFYGLKLHMVDISWDVVQKSIIPIMTNKGGPVHSIEPQIYQAAIQAKCDGIQTMIIGESSDLIFGGMDQLLSKDWAYEDFKKRYIFTQPDSVLVNADNVDYLFERYRKEGEGIDFLKFMDDVFSVESSDSYRNAFDVAKMDYVDPYASFKMAEPLDLARVRNGESKYLIRELFSERYPTMEVPEKVPMPRPVEYYFSKWKGPTRKEFIANLNMDQFSGNQKWQIWCLEKFLDMIDNM